MPSPTSAMFLLVPALACLLGSGCTQDPSPSAREPNAPASTEQAGDPTASVQAQDRVYQLHPIGEVVRRDGKTLIVLKEKYQPGLMGLENFPQVTVVYWFDRNDTPERRSILQVHPRGNRENPKRGVFATHAPVRPNLIAISRCRILRIDGNVIEVDKIDAFDHSPVLDLKN